MQVPEDRAFLKIVGFEWAKFEKSVVLPFTETLSTFSTMVVLIVLWKPLGV